MISKAHSDIQSYIDAIPYGSIVLHISKVNRKVVAIETEGKETLRYTDTDAALHDIQAILKNLHDTSYSGSAHIELEYKDGQVSLVTIHDKKKTQY
jgi:hypothetical protein